MNQNIRWLFTIFMLYVPAAFVTAVCVCGCSALVQLPMFGASLQHCGSRFDWIRKASLRVSAFFYSATLQMPQAPDYALETRDPPQPVCAYESAFRYSLHTLLHCSQRMQWHSPVCRLCRYVRCDVHILQPHWGYQS